MRWIFYALFFFNIGLFAFGFWVMNPSGELLLVEPAPVKGIGGRVALLSETAFFEPSVVDKRTSVSSLRSGEFLVSESPRLVNAQTQAEGSPPKCFRIGPFSNSRAADAYQNQIGFNDGLVRIEKHPIAKDSKYWVYIPPVGTKDEALATLRSLQVAGVDSFVVLKGPFTYAISLGTFMKPDSADALKEQVTSLGYSVSVDVQQNVRNDFWLYLQAVESSQQKAIETHLSAGLNLSVFSCEMFAQDKIFP